MKLATMTTGIRQEMVLRISRYTKPSRMATLQTSPMQPGIRPISRSAMERLRLLSGVSTVADVTVSKGSGNAEAVFVAVMRPGQDASRTARAMSAGLTKLHPIPPNSCFTSRMATAAPMRIIHQGAVAGRFSARITPVTAADRSLMRMGFLNSFW